MTLTGEPRTPLERQPVNAFPRSFAIGYDELDDAVSDRDESDATTAPRPSRRQRRQQRRISRRRLVVMPLALALVLLSVALLGVSWWSRQGLADYDDGHYESSQVRFDQLRSVDVIDPWKAWMGIGTARFRMGDLAGAEAAFGTALELNEDRCDVRFNLVVTIEADGDRRMGNDVNEVTETEKLDGLARYRVALDFANAAPCPAGAPDEPGARLAQTRERLEAKLGGEGTPQDESSMDDPDDNSEDDGERSDSSSQEDQLEQRNQEGAAERQDSSDIDPTSQQPPREPNW